MKRKLDEKEEETGGEKKKQETGTEGEEKEKIALVTGITGQDGSYLAELLLEKDTQFMGLSEDHHASIPEGLIIYIKIVMKLK